MTTAQTDERAEQKPLRLWPGVLAVTLLWLIRFGLPVVAPESQIVAIIAGLTAGALRF